MDDEKLIVLVEANECLYNKYSPGYKKVDKKRIIWRQIAAEMDYSEEVCQKRWTSLRDRYVREKRLENLPSGSEAKNTTQWPLLQTMEFIAPYVIPRPMRCSQSICKEIENISQSSSQSPLSDTSPICEPPPISMPSPLPDMDSTFEPILPSPVTQARAKRKRVADNDDDKQFSQAMEAFTKLCENKTEKPEKEDAVTGFSKMIAATIRTMSETNQILTMQRVTSLVMQMKLEQDK